MMKLSFGGGDELRRKTEWTTERALSDAAACILVISFKRVMPDDYIDVVC